MLWNIFKTAVGMSVAASITALILVPLKILLKKLSFPRKYLMLLWIIIVLRLVCPYSPQSSMSIYNLFENEKTQAVVSANIGSGQIHITSKTVAPPQKIYNPATGTLPKAADGKNAVLAIWIFGILLINGYSILANSKLRRSLRFSTRLRDNIYESDTISVSFVFGFFKPKIYIPVNTTDTDRQNMIIHEKTHIKYMHNRIKLLFRIIVSIHWFNPAVWFLYRLISYDMEYVCDESSVHNVNKNSYINSLFDASKRQTKAVPSPDVCSFSSLSKRRIASLAKYQKQSKLYIVPVIAVCIASLLVLCTAAKEKTDVLQSYLAIPYASEARICEPAKINFSEPEDSENAVTDIKEKARLFATDVPTPADANTAGTKTNLSKYKSVEKSDMLYEGFYNLEPEGINADILSQELENSKLTNTAVGADLKENYIKGNYTSTPDGVTVPSVMCDENGNISLYISLNTDSLFEVNVFDNETEDNVYGCMVLATGKNAYSFMGFEHGKKYDISFKELTKGQWKTEGTYIIY